MAQKSIAWPSNVPERQRPSASKILPHLYVGNFASSANAKFLSDRNIKFILNVTPSPSCNVQPDIEYLSISINDNEKEDILSNFDQSIEFINKAKAAGPNHNILVHCHFGISRSVTIVIAYVMKEKEWPLARAMKFVRDRHPNGEPNFGFFHQMCEYEKKLYGKVSMTNEEFSFF